MFSLNTLKIWLIPFQKTCLWYIWLIQGMSTPIRSHVVVGLKSKFLFLFRSEANDLALRLARQYTRKEDIVAMEE